MVSNVYLHGHVLMREDGHVLRMGLDFDIEGHKEKGKLKMTCKQQVEEESMKGWPEMHFAKQCGLLALIRLD